MPGHFSLYYTDTIDLKEAPLGVKIFVDKSTSHCYNVTVSHERKA